MTVSRRTDETGNHYGDLIVESAAPTKHGKAWWLCHCQACGSSKPIAAAMLRNGSATHCGCKTPRDVPTVAALQKRMDELEARLAQLESRPAAAPAKPEPKKGLQNRSLANPLGLVSGRIWQPPSTPEEAAKRATQLAALPFSERGKQAGRTLKDLQDELGACVLAIAKQLNEDVDADSQITLTQAYKDRMRHLSALQAAQKNYAFETSGQDYDSWFTQ